VADPAALAFRSPARLKALLKEPRSEPCCAGRWHGLDANRCPIGTAILSGIRSLALRSYRVRCADQVAGR